MDPTHSDLLLVSRLIIILTFVLTSENRNHPDLHLLPTMDPISVAASLFTVLGAAATASRALEYLISLRHAPDQLAALINEVSVFYNPESILWMEGSLSCPDGRLAGSAEQCTRSCSRANQDIARM